jgi:hypothetical protein
VRLVPKNRNVRIFPSALRSHRSTAGCHDGIPQNSPILVHNSSADSVEVAVKRDSSASVEVVAETSNAVADRADATRFT